MVYVQCQPVRYSSLEFRILIHVHKRHCLYPAVTPVSSQAPDDDLMPSSVGVGHGCPGHMCQHCCAFHITSVQWLWLIIASPLAFPCASFLIILIILWAPIILQWFPFCQNHYLFSAGKSPFFFSSMLWTLSPFFPSFLLFLSFFSCLPPEITIKTFCYEVLLYYFIPTLLLCLYLNKNNSQSLK